MTNAMFDGSINTAELITLDCLMEDLSEEDKKRLIQIYKKNYPEKWSAYLEHHKYLNYTTL